MRLSRKLGLVESVWPAQIFATINGFSNAGRNNGTAGKLTKAKPTWASAGTIFYSFFCVADSVEISKIVVANDSSLSKTTLCAVSYINSPCLSQLNGTSLESIDSIRGGLFLCLRFNNTYPASVIDRVLKNMLKRYIGGGIRGSSSTIAESSSKFPKTSIDDYTGLVFTAFYDTTNSQVGWSFSDSKSPLVTIPSTGEGAGGRGSSWLTGASVLHAVGDYYAPVAANNSTPNVSCYTYMMFGPNVNGINSDGYIPWIGD